MIVRNGQNIVQLNKYRVEQVWKIIVALNGGYVESLTDDDIKLAAEIIADQGLTQDDMNNVENLVKEQIILELSGIERMFDNEN